MQRRSALARLRRRQRTGPVALLVIFVLVALFAFGYELGRDRVWRKIVRDDRSAARP